MHEGKKRFRKRTAGRVAQNTGPEPLEARRLLSAACAVFAQPDVSALPSATAATVQGYTPAQIRHAYGFDTSSTTGTGQTIAIIDAYKDANIAADLATFDRQFTLAAPASLKVVNQSGGSASSVTADAGWATETSLDVEWAHAIAPAANILLVETSSDNLNDLMAGVNYARHATGVSVISMSWGISEFRGEQTYDSYFTTPTGHAGVTFVAASGDDGLHQGVQWPATSPNVVAVGGTSLHTATTAAAYSNESAWSGSTGGTSRIEREPAWQHSAQQTGARTTPDVAYNADPNTGFAVYDSVSYDGSAGWQVYGGTSAGAPQWSAMIALADQSRSTAHLAPLDGPTQTLPALYQPYSTAATYTLDYHDISGTARSALSGATGGYDVSTGLGSPKPALERSLANTGTTSAQAPLSPALRQAAPAASAAPAVVFSPGNASVPPPGVQPSFQHGGPPPQASRLPAIFSESPVPSGTLAVSGGRLAEVASSISAARSPAPAVAEAVLGAAGQRGGELVQWLGLAWATGGLDTAAASIDAPATGPDATAVPAGEPLAQAAVALTTTLAASPAVQLPAGAIYRFANFNPVTTFADAVAEFAAESASLTTLGTVPAPGSHRALNITAGVLIVDLILVGRWYAGRWAAKKAARQLSPEQLRAGFLPSDL